MALFKKLFGNMDKSEIKSLASDLKPDNWITFYLFYFNQGLGADATFHNKDKLIHLFVGNIISQQNSDKILEAINSRHEYAAGEFMHILAQLTKNDINILNSSAGASLVINRNSGEAASHLYQSNKLPRRKQRGIRKASAVDPHVIFGNQFPDV